MNDECFIKERSEKRRMKGRGAGDKEGGGGSADYKVCNILGSKLNFPRKSPVDTGQVCVCPLDSRKQVT
jgi:hypothetical protein